MHSFDVQRLSRQLPIWKFVPEVVNLCRLRFSPWSTYIPLKTTPTTALPLVRTTLKPKVQGSNPAREFFSLHSLPCLYAHARM